MGDDKSKARVFISCGQSDEDEKRVAAQIKKKLSDELGFDVYMADSEHTCEEVLHSVLEALEESEYFLMIDFKREQLANLAYYRGSLFSHQELAIATFLKIEQLRFREIGVQLEGIASLLQGRIEFPDRAKLVDLILSKVAEAGWKSEWKNAIRILSTVEREDDVDRHITLLCPLRESQNYSNSASFVAPFPTSNRTSAHSKATFWHLVVENLNNRKTVLDSRCFLIRFDKISGDDLPTKIRDHVEQKWAGVVFQQGVAIPPKQCRRVCAFFAEAGENGIRFHQHFIDTDSAEASAPFDGRGKYVLEYVVHSANFPPAQRKFKLTLTGKREEIKLEPI